MDRRTLLKAAAVVVPAAAAIPLLTASPALATPRRGRTLATGLDIPWGIDFLSDGSALVNERDRARMLRVFPDGSREVVGTVPGVAPDGEGGLLGLALSPSFATDQRVYITYSTETDNRIAWIKYDGTSLVGDPQPIVTGIPRASNHNGGGLWFTEFGNLFATTGDAGQRERAQNKNSLGGKILRLKPDGTGHPDNPFVGRAGDDRIYSYGHRNVEGITKGADGRIWASELGENTWDELNQILPGRNYGWPRVEGSDGAGGYRNPLAQWHTDAASPSAVALRRGRAWIGALRGQCLWAVELSGPNKGRRTRYFHNTFGRIRMVKRAPDDTLWIGTSNGGNNDKIVQITFV
jgi:glucose/arabinose dehydrogenase